MNEHVYIFVVQDLAQRFADGRLSTEKILSANDEELAEMLIQVRGIGRVSMISNCSPRANELVSYHNVLLFGYVTVDRQVDSALSIRRD